MKIKEIIVVEGKSDVSVLKNIIDADFIITNGSAIDQNTLDLIKSASESRGVILFLDPDSPGEKIRHIISSYVKNVKHAFVKTSDAKKDGKVGVAQTDKQNILFALNNLITFEEPKNQIMLSDFYDLGLIGQNNSNKYRQYIANYYHFGLGSAKTILKRINMLNITIEELLERIKECL